MARRRLGPRPVVGGRTRTAAAVARSLSNRLFAACVTVFAVLVVSAVALWLLEGDNPEVTGPVSGFAYVARAMIEGSTPWPLTTRGGRIVHEVVLITGRSVVALATGAIASKLVEVVIRRGAGMDRARVRDHIVICGWSSKGSEILRELHAKEMVDTTPVVVLAPLPASPTRDPLTTFVQGNPTAEEDLKRAGIEHARTAIILADDSRIADADDVDARTLLVTLAVEAVNSNCYTCVEVIRSQNRPHFQRTQANELVVSAELTGALLASSAKTHGMSGLIGDLVTHPHGSEFYALEVPSSLVGIEFAEAVGLVKRTSECLLVGVGRHEDAPFRINPPGNLVLEPGNRLVVVADRPPVLQ